VFLRPGIESNWSQATEACQAPPDFAEITYRTMLEATGQAEKTSLPSIPVDQWLPAWEAARRSAEQIWFEVGPAFVQSRIFTRRAFRFPRRKSTVG
jgi:hypothetical protein